MAKKTKPILFPKLVLCTSLSRNYYVPRDETDDNPNSADEALRDSIHEYPVKAFRSIFYDLEIELGDAGYETFTEFYTDMHFEDYELHIGNRSGQADDVEAIVKRFHKRAKKVLASLPDIIDRVEVAETI